MKNIIKVFNDIALNLKSGIHKKWIYRKGFCDLAFDALQKLKYSISDLNTSIDTTKTYKPKDVIYQIVLASWVEHSIKIYRDCLLDSIVGDFKNCECDKLDKPKEYLRAIRSFVVAHPLKTDRHEAIGFDGDLICSDIYTKPWPMHVPLTPKNRIDFLTINGIVSEGNINDSDYLLKVYSKKTDDFRFYKLLCCKLSDLYGCINSFIDDFVLMNSFLSKLKKANYISVIKGNKNDK